MSDDFGTVNARGAERAREIEVLRQHYRTHRDALGRMAGEAPSEHLAAEYQRLVREIDTALGKLDELEGKRPATPPLVAAGATDNVRLRTSPGHQPLAAPPSGMYNEPAALPPPAAGSGLRTVLILGIGALVLGAIIWLVWHASKGRESTKSTETIVEQPVTSTTSTSTTASTTSGRSTSKVEPAPVTPAVSSAALTVAPAVADYGAIRKGTRAVRQFEIRNTTAAPIAIQVARSNCRCLYYEYSENIAAKAKETITVTIDGARAKGPTLEETVQVSAKKDPAVTAQFKVVAAIK